MHTRCSTEFPNGDIEEELFEKEDTTTWVSLVTWISRDKSFNNSVTWITRDKCFISVVIIISLANKFLSESQEA
jgi:hypothetical protein